MKKLTAIVTSLALVLVLAACGAPVDDVEPELLDIAATAEAAGDFGTLLAALTEADLAATFADDAAGPFTVFAPTDAAFDALLTDLGATAEELLAREDLGDILRYHVLDGAFLAEDVVELITVGGGSATVDTLLADASLTLTLDGDSVIINGDVTVTVTDILATNGVIHVIDAVLLPPSEPEPQSIATIATEAGVFETLLSILPEDLAAALSDDDAGPFTVFAPTDDAFDAIAAVLPTLSEEDVREILELHVVDGAVSSTDAIAAVSARSLGSELLYFIVDGDDLRVDGVALVVDADIEASNGVIHVIDTVLLPKGTIVDVAVAAATSEDAEFTVLVDAVLEADTAVFDTLADVEAGPFTVFAPTDAAFAALPDGALQALLDDQAALTNVLLYHVTDAGALLASQVIALVADGPIEVEMLNADDVTVTLDGASVTVNDATVVVTDILTANGVIHVIDAVLLP